MPTESTQPRMKISRSSNDDLLVHLSGNWRLGDDIPTADDILGSVESEPGIKRIVFESDKLGHWDSGLLTFVIKFRELCRQKKIRVNISGLPQGAQKLLALASAVPEKKDARSGGINEPFLTRVGEDAINFFRTVGQMLTFIGEVIASFGRLLIGKAQFRRSDLTLTLQECGAQALPIVSLISLLVGLILAFIGAVQLKLFGAEIYVANLVAISVVRVMGAVMTGIIMAGRTGAAFAAQLGTMETNEEIDALKTLGISPIDFLVLPRILGLTLMMPLLCLYANLMGILGGLIVSVSMLNIGFVQYYNQTKGAVTLTDLWIGLFHGMVFGVLVALAGCLRGMQCGRSASAVGDAATSAVVTGIVSIILATATITIMCNVLGI
ncbi:MAG: ABC transporter permease [Desulfobacteraceae bacterium]|nr:ABC transporter permease [Desulfobacteraceae bacterium]